MPDFYIVPELGSDDRKALNLKDIETRVRDAMQDPLCTRSDGHLPEATGKIIFSRLINIHQGKGRACDYNELNEMIIGFLKYLNYKSLARIFSERYAFGKTKPIPSS